mmetsp:Transcript_62284/g.157395  ORF Transcript_62284/g.157395 Transcript_62284/m.157395 type:complete len:1365 (+) Transcript_62284:122-4216(+)|eukprot:CAMPEP_0115370652 /NCGR_PEP_ID=MMETSP0270-20121206/106941_1 /TAXON_ID=71861 /ORGANISM="Scrippsiella trochoidea, Strain CCMP3099" /LENGTH=1364 /DNA_ID=CAMNT_0002793481 /DNA_START=30 /DNA_END=4124 /DNA_ORIENTATION=+
MPKDKKNKKGAKADSDDDIPEKVPDAALEESDDEPPRKAPPKKNMMMALMDSDDDDEDEEPPEEELTAQFGDKKKKKKEKKDKDGQADEMAEMFGEKKKKSKKDKEDDDEKEEKKEKKEKKSKKEKEKPRPLVCEVLEVQPIPKKDKLRLCKVAWRAGAEPVDVVTNAPNIVVGKKFVIALPGVTTANGIEVKEAKVGGKDSVGMFCGPNELGWDTDVLDENLAVQLADSAEVGTSIPSYEEAVQALKDREKAVVEEKGAGDAKKGKKGKKKGGKEADDDDDLDAILAQEGIKVEEKPAEPAKGKKGKKGKAAKDDADEEDLDAILAAEGIKVEEKPPEPAKGKKGKKGKAAKDDGDDDFDSALNEFKPPPREEIAADPAPAAKEADTAADPEEEQVDAKTLANRKKKDKKKAKAAGAGGDDDDFDAILAEEGSKAPAAPAAAAASSSAEAPAKPAEAAAAPKEEEEEVVDAKTLANRKKKDKKKAKQGGAGFFAGDAEKKDEGEDKPAEEASPPAAPKAEAKKGAKGKPESAIVRKAREEMERKKALEEERLAFEAEQKRLIEEEERKIREEEERIEAERQRKRDARAAKIQRQKDEGTYMSKAEKERAKRAALLREQFGFSMEKDDDDEGEEEKKKDEAAPKKRPLATKLKKKKKEDDEEDDEAAAARAKAKAEQEAAEKKKKEEEERAKKEAEAKKKKADDDDDGDDWEIVAEKIDSKAEAEDEDEDDDEEEKDEDDEDEDEEGSESGSDSDSSSGSSSDSFAGYRSPILVIMGHVDTGKTKLLDKIRKTNVQEGEAGGITQQIGATFFPDIALMEQTKKVDPDFDIEVPGIMVIDTPGHESFNNLRKRGSALCDMAILVIDIMHGLEPQTVESLELLKQRKCFFVIALNKCDVCYQWNSKPYTSIRDALDRQEQFVRDEFYQRLDKIKLDLNSRGLNVALYWENEEPGRTVSIIPTSALTGEGVPDLLYMALRSAQTVMPSEIEVKEDEFTCTVIEVKNIEGLGTTIDVILVNGTLRKGDQIVIAGINGPIVTTIRALLTPQPMKEMRVKSEYVHHEKISTSMGIKICAPGLEDAIAGNELLVVGPDDDLEDVKAEIEDACLDPEDASILQSMEKEPAGVYVKASTLGSLEALLSFLSDMKIPVFDMGIGEVQKKDVKKACIMKEKKHPEYAVILAFDVKVNPEAVKQAATDDVQIMTADIIYHLQDKFKTYMEKIQESRKVEKKDEAVFPVILQMDKQYIFRKTDPIVVGCTVMGGQLRPGTPICIPDKDNICIGRVGGIEKERKPVQMARRGESVCVKIEQNTSQTHITYGRHFDYTNLLYSQITRSSIDCLKENFKDEMKKEDWELIIGMKALFKIQ